MSKIETARTDLRPKHRRLHDDADLSRTSDVLSIQNLS